ncbi:hypothetical protein BDP27DRAFT_1357696 [Rhodocollybia butyracea]|uniref:Uncharacterized protein n=1 Tax=Rhodocollybia butyracea TaxID=206335 RepID=A0A9P5UF56_9AGAR|nr:hypothetical protein BDP27DRAFT_1357696 [Rhodocollybia butyracea]
MRTVVSGQADRQSLDYAASLSSSSAPSFNTDTCGVTQPSISQSFSTLSTAASATTRKINLDLFKMDFTTLLHRRRHSVILADPAQVAVDGTREQLEMLADHEDSERPARRKSNSEHKFYHFLTRSRSRSSKRTTASASISEELVPENDQSIHSRQSSWSSARSSQNRPISSGTASTSKPSNIRPMSTTTTTTATTIQPPTPKPRRQLPPPVVPQSPSKKKLHIFGRGDDDGHDEFPRPARQSSSEPSTSSNSHKPSKLENLFKPTRFFSSSRRTQSPPPVLSLSHSNNVVSPMPTPSSSNSGSLSNHVPVSKPVSISRRRASTNDSISSLSSSAHRAVPVHAPQPRPPATADGSVSMPLPRITHTPATPSRSGTAPPRLSSHHHRKDSLESQPSYRYRPLTMDMVNEERDSKELDVKGKGKETEDSNISRPSSKSRESDHSSASAQHHHSSRHPPIKPKTSNLANIRSAKHGSFDFERPGWGSSVVRSMSGTSGRSGLSGGRYSRSGESVGSGTRGKDDEPVRRKAVNAKVSSKREEHKSQKKAFQEEDDPAPPYSPTPAADKGLSSSLGRSGGKRSGIARLIGLASHGAFPFEPPVPSPTFSQDDATSDEKKDIYTDGERGRRRREKEKEKHRSREVTEEKEKARVRDRNRSPEQNDTAGTSSFLDMSTRPSRKGRSLDLGIGLSWAPTKVREDLLIPGGVFGVNGRISDSTSSRNGLRTRSKTVDEFGVETQDKSKVGRDVAEVFKKVLDPEGYNAFKKYVHQFDAHEIPFDGQNGIIARAQRLLDKRSELGEESKRKLVDRLAKIVLQNA